MLIEFWSDIICPFCGLGHHRLTTALDRFEHADEVTVVNRSFQLDPTAAVGVMEPALEMMKRKGMPVEQFEATGRHLQEVARTEGLDPYIVVGNRVGSTAYVHQFLAHATAAGQGDEAWTAAYRRYFGEEGDVFTKDGVAELGELIGFDGDVVRKVIDDGIYIDQITTDAAEAQSLGARGVPFLVIDRKYGVAGAQPLELFTQTIETAWANRQDGLLHVGDGATCGPDGCAH